MKSSLISFNKGLADLRHYIQTLEIESNLLSTPIKNVAPSASVALLSQLRELVSISSSKRRFDYNSIVVSLYGFLEQFVESVIRNYVSYLNAIVPKYNLLPEIIVKNHVELAFGLISRASQTRYRGTVEVAQVISYLDSCLSDADKYQIATEAFTHHTANFRSDVVDQTFARIGVTDVSRRVRDTDVFAGYLHKVYPERDISSIKQEEIFFYLNDLAERRNEVAHGTPSEILSNDLLLEYVEFFEAYGPSLYSVIRSDAFHFEIAHHGIELGLPISVYNNSIVCLSMKNTPVKVGDLLIARTANSACPYLGSEIQEIQVNGISHEEIGASPSIDVAMRVTYKAKGNQSFFLVPKQVLTYS